jgi:hypothetical protein
MKKGLYLIIFAVIYFGFKEYQKSTTDGRETRQTEFRDDSALATAIAQKLSNKQVEGQGTVVKILPDDSVGSRHQKFILKLDSGQTLLVAHNIDLAPRIASLRTGDTVAFYGEYEWNPKGGVIHWTHHDPAKRHIDGWLKHHGKTYQ